jgi:hypothetical protein
MSKICENCWNSLDDEFSIYCPSCEEKLTTSEKLLLYLLKETKKSSNWSDLLNRRILLLAIGTFVLAVLSVSAQIITLPDWFKIPFLLFLLAFYIVVALLVYFAK